MKSRSQKFKIFLQCLKHLFINMWNAKEQTLFLIGICNVNIWKFISLNLNFDATFSSELISLYLEN